MVDVDDHPVIGVMVKKAFGDSEAEGGSVCNPRSTWQVKAHHEGTGGEGGSL